MSHETVRRWVIEQDYLDRTRHTVTQWNGEPICVEVIRASDYDALRTQARELAEVTMKDRAEACPFVEGSHGAQVWMASDTGAQLAQAVLDATKEGA